MDRRAHYLLQIRAACPHFRVETVRSGLSGQFNDVLIVNEATVFRFPRYDSVAAKLSFEAGFLRAIGNLVSLPVPQPVACGLGPNVAKPFMSYPLIEGAPLWRTTVDAIDSGTMDVLIHQLWRFLHSLHSVAPSLVADDLPNLESRDRWLDVYSKMRIRLFPHMRDDVCVAVAERFETFVSESRSFDYQPVLRHGDPGPGNILFNEAIGRISGIIDFDCAGLGDPAVDWSIVLAPCLFGEGFVRRFLSLHPVCSSIRSRAAFYRSVWPFQEALRVMEAGETKAFDRAIAAYR